jgi:phosphonoacetaldehyde hydrolase
MSYRASTKVLAVVFDFAGTIVDYGSCAPLAAFQDVFAASGVPITAEIARGPMGKNKRDHISEILSVPSVTAAWTTAHGGIAPTEKDIDMIYANFTPVQIAAARVRATPIPGAIEALQALRARGIKIGGNSGYNKEIMDAVVEESSKFGLIVDAIEFAGPANGRPKPWMSTRVLEKLDCFPLSACVKVDDTLPGIVEGRNAGMWTVGVSRSGNELGLTKAEADELQQNKPTEYAERMKRADARFREAGAHFVIDSVASIEDVVNTIEKLMQEGKNPNSN